MKLASLNCYLLLFTFELVGGYSLDSSGYYKLIVAIDDRTVQNSIEQYTENIKRGFQELSQILYNSTNSKFSIKEVDIVVPYHWNVEFDDIATNQYYDVADVKISHLYYLPTVNNPNLCGRSGIDIQLPYNFFDTADSGAYGNVGKALLTQFSRWRYGVWEEHGYPSDTTFPYFWKPLSGTSWDINACSNVPITGDYNDTNDGSDCSPSLMDQYPPAHSCRFYPYMDQQNSARASLMGYHYLPTIDSFCNAQTHNKLQPTPQNLFCRYQSIMETIEASQDWKGVHQPNQAAPVIFKVLKISPLPLLSIILDASITPAPSYVLSQISAHLNRFVGDAELGNVIATLAKYPGDVDGTFSSELVSWTSLNNGLNEFSNAINNTFGKQQGFRNFAGAIDYAVRSTNARKHPKGSVVLVVKTTAETNTVDLKPESDVLTQLLLAKQKLFAIEIQGSDIQPGIALQKVVNVSEGVHLILNSTSNLEVVLTEFFESLKTTMLREVTTTRGYVVALRDVLPYNSTVIPKVNSRVAFFEVFCTPISGSISNPRLRTTGGIGNRPDANLVLLEQWGSTVSTGRSLYYFAPTAYSTPLEYIAWDEFTYTCLEGECQVLVTVFVKVSDITQIPSITLSVSTSASGTNFVDMAQENSPLTTFGVPFAIYAKLEQEGNPVMFIQNLSVVAYITHSETSELYQVALNDNGNAVEDLIASDGVFSGVFVPQRDGDHEIFVTVKYTKKIVKRESDESLKTNLNPRSEGKLFPIDPREIGCGVGNFGCWVEQPQVEFVLSEDLSSSIRFVNVSKYLAMAHRIMDFKATPIGENKIHLQWTEPGVFTQNGIERIDSYEIKQSDQFDQLLSDFESAVDLFPSSELPSSGEPGTAKSIIVEYGEEADRYFAIKAITSLSGSNLSPVISNIASANIRQNVLPTTTTSTLPTTPRPTRSSTTMPTTLESEATEVTKTTVDPSSSTVPTSPRTSKPTSSAPKTTSTLKPSTKPPPTPTSTASTPTKHWFQKTEGIITISVFSTGIVFLFLSGFIIIKLKRI